MASLFTRIIQGEIPCHRLFENDLVIAFLDVNPLSIGHALVVSKQEKPQFHELSQESARAMGEALAQVSAAILQVTGATAYNILQNNGALAHQEVMHVHFHIIPKYLNGQGLEMKWSAQPIDHAAAATLAKSIQKKLADI